MDENSSWVPQEHSNPTALAFLLVAACSSRPGHSLSVLPLPALPPGALGKPRDSRSWLLESRDLFTPPKLPWELRGMGAKGRELHPNMAACWI